MFSLKPDFIYAENSFENSIFDMYTYIIIPWKFFTPITCDGLSVKFEWQHVFRTLLSILTNPINAVVCMVSAPPPNPNSSSALSNPLGIVPCTAISIAITVTFIFHSDFFFVVFEQGRSICLHFGFHLFSLCGWLGRHSLPVLFLIFY